MIRELSLDSRSFLRFDDNINGAVFVAVGFGTSLICLNEIVYIFDSHSRDFRGLPHPSGTSILLRFNSVIDAEEYIKLIFIKLIFGYVGRAMILYSTTSKKFKW